MCGFWCDYFVRVGNRHTRKRRAVLVVAFQLASRRLAITKFLTLRRQRCVGQGSPWQL
ncbi:hypothetical protein HMPREF9599_01363 [Cutibacterium acnes HL050PA2]|nr:hypothetical protein HMPREF9599_01363 [Cutibacterium acnes HL050PA2]